jgi:glycosyltransferase involved in cell wall biosynthesis
MRVVLNAEHIGAIGGGENYLMRLAMALNKISDFYIVRNFHPKFKEFNGFGETFKEYNGFFKPDIFIHASHFRSHLPVGRRNYCVSFFPKPSLIPIGYDGVLAICDYASRYSVEYWNPKRVDVAYPPIDVSLYSPASEKRKQIISIGHFFEESDGHSKNQHILAQALTPELIEAGLEVVFVGNSNPGDEPYVRKLKKFCEGKPCRVEVNKDDRFLKTELARSSFLWHANGYGRTDPAQAEHFGIIVLEALASGVVPIVHDSGGAREIAGIVWDKPEDLGRITLAGPRLPKLDDKYTVEFFNKRIAEWLDSISGVETTTVKDGLTLTQETVDVISKPTSSTASLSLTTTATM